MVASTTQLVGLGPSFSGDVGYAYRAARREEAATRGVLSQFPVSGEGDVGRQGQEDLNIISRDENPEV